jgi:hypothetical protein
VRRRAVAVLALLVALLAAGGVAVARDVPDLHAAGPTGVTGTEATAVYRIGEHTVREVRYADGGTLAYTFRLRNDGRLPLTVRGLDPDQQQPRLFTYLSLTDGSGSGSFVLGSGETTAVTLRLRMGGCETLSARAGSFVRDVAVLTRSAGVFDDTTTVPLPEELHTGSPREAFCPESTATSRPPG